MQHHDEENGGSQQNSQSEIQEQTSDDLPPEPSQFLAQVGEITEPASESLIIEDKIEVEVVEKCYDENIHSESPSTRSKSSKQISKKISPKQKTDLDISGQQTDLTNGNGFTESSMSDDVSKIADDETEVVEEDAHDVTISVPAEINGIIDPTEVSEQTEYEESLDEDEKSESTQEVTEEELHVTASVVRGENYQSAGIHLEGTDKFSLSTSSSESYQTNSNSSNELKEDENPFNPENLFVSGSSWGVNIRSVSARRPVHKHTLVTGRSSVSSERQGNTHLSKEENQSHADCTVDTVEGSIFASLKRKAFETDNTSFKKRKVNDSKNSLFYSMVSSPLRLFRNKLSDRIEETHGVIVAENVSNDKNDDGSDENIDDQIKKGDNDLKEKRQCVVAGEVNNQNTLLYKSWCSIM